MTHIIGGVEGEHYLRMHIAGLEPLVQVVVDSSKDG